MTNFEKLNEIIAANSKTLPPHRRQISRSLGNLRFFKKLNIQGSSNAEFLRLLNLNPKQMFEPYQAQNAEPRPPVIIEKEAQ